MEDTTTTQESSTVQPINATVEPVNSNGQYPVMGGFWERFAAYFLDGMIIGTGSSLISMVFIVFSNGDTSVLYILGRFVSFGAGLFYYIYFYTKNGQTLGKKIVKLKVVNAVDLQYMSWGKVVLRELVGKSVGAAVFSLGFLWYFMSEKRQTWHDSIASTYVVKTDEKGEILMNGPATYEKKPLYTFLAVLGFLVFGLATVIFVIIVMSSVLFGPGSGISDLKFDTTPDYNHIIEEKTNELQDNKPSEVKTNEVPGSSVDDMIEQMNKMQKNMDELDKKVVN